MTADSQVNSQEIIAANDDRRKRRSKIVISSLIPEAKIAHARSPPLFSLSARINCFDHDRTMKCLNLAALHQGLPAITPAYGVTLAEAAAVCLNAQGHQSGVTT
jgi:hypothetical protein